MQRFGLCMLTMRILQNPGKVETSCLYETGQYATRRLNAMTGERDGVGDVDRRASLVRDGCGARKRV